MTEARKKRRSSARRGRNDPAFISWTPSSWREAVEVAEGMHGWLFRGQEDNKWGLTSSLERIADSYGCPADTLSEQEEEILNQFKRQAGHYLVHLPDDRPNGGDNLEWLSLIQHHGGPTRLLDFTRSFYVAAFFAAETAKDTSVIWAVNQTALNRSFIERADLAPEGSHKPTLAEAKTRCTERCIKRSLGFRDSADAIPANGESIPDPVLDNPNVIAVRPWRLNQRMTIQQGWFLFPTSLDTTFAHNLCSALDVPATQLPTKTSVPSVQRLKRLIAEPSCRLAVLRINFPREMHLGALRDLQRMNITAATLFPGLDGFARSLRFPLRLFEDLVREDGV